MGMTNAEVLVPKREVCTDILITGYSACSVEQKNLSSQPDEQTGF